MPTQSAPQKTIRSILLDAMRSGVYANAAHLPPETELAVALGISRTQLRDALAVLEQEGFITRRHGIGTLINRHVLNVPVRMDMELELLEIIRSCGYRPDLAFVRTVENTSPDEEISRRLGISPDTPVLRVDRLCTADGRPAIYCVDVIERSLIQQPYTQEDLDKPIFHFLQEICGVNAYMDLTDLSPVLADEALAEVLKVPVGSPLLCMCESDYDISGKLIFRSVQYFADGFFHHTVLRKRL